MTDSTGPVTRLAASSYDPHAVTPFFGLWDDGRAEDDPGKQAPIAFTSNRDGSGSVRLGSLPALELTVEQMNALVDLMADRHKPAPCCGDDCPCTEPLAL